MHVLIIEDESMIAMHVQEYMRDLGFESFAIAESEDEAIRCAQEQRPDLILADYRLKQGTGVEAVKRICLNEPIPTVYVAALATDVKAADPSATVLEKPFLSHDLARAVRAAQRQS